MLEEIHGVELSEFRFVESFVMAPDAPAIRGWQGGVADWSVVLRVGSRSMRLRMNLGPIGPDALRAVVAELRG